jgi:hypothetical protein
MSKIMATIKETKNGIAYLIGVLKEKRSIVTRVALWKIPHKTFPYSFLMMHFFVKAI